MILTSPLFERLSIILRATQSARPEPPTISVRAMYWDEELTDFYEGDLSVYNPCAFTLDAATVPAGSPEREEMHIMHAFVTLRHISGAQQQAVPGFAAAHANTVFFHMTYFGILSMPGAPVLDYCVDVRASVWVRMKGSTIISTWSSCSATQTVPAFLLMLEGDTRSTPTSVLLFSVWTRVDARHLIGVCA